jgi:hypothetical protein
MKTDGGVWSARREEIQIAKAEAREVQQHRIHLRQEHQKRAEKPIRVWWSGPVQVTDASGARIEGEFSDLPGTTMATYAITAACEGVNCRVPAVPPGSPAPERIDVMPRIPDAEVIQALLSRTKVSWSGSDEGSEEASSQDT